MKTKKIQIVFVGFSMAVAVRPKTQVEAPIRRLCIHRLRRFN